MTTPMRWADSDSDDSDGGYNVNEESSDTYETEEALTFSDNQKNQAAVTNTPPFSQSANSNDRIQRGHQYHNHHPKTNKKGGNGGNYSGGGKNRFKHPQQSITKNRGGKGPENWKELAKASSRFSSDGNSNGSIDGSSWMAQRKAKMEQEANEQKQKEAERMQQEQEAKQSRRKSQLSALKAAMCEIKQEQVEEVSRKQENNSSGLKDTPSSNVRILKKNASTPSSKIDSDTEGSKNQDQVSLASSNKQNDPKKMNQRDKMTTKGSWRRGKSSSGQLQTESKPLSQPQAPKYSYTIGQSPSIAPKQKISSLKAELQPDRLSVKFNRERGALTDNQIITTSKVENNQYTTESKAQNTKDNVPISKNHKHQATDGSGDNANREANRREKGKQHQRVIVAFDDGSGHPSTEKKKSKNKELEKTTNSCDENDCGSNLMSSCHDENNDEEVASIKTSSSRGSSTMHSSSRSSRGGGGGKNRGRGNPKRRDSRSKKGGRGRGRGRGRGSGRGREGRGSQNSSNATLRNNMTERKGRSNVAESGKGGATQTTNNSNIDNSKPRNGGGRFAGREGERRDSQSGRIACEGGRSNENHEPSSGRGRTKSARGNDGRGGRGHKSAKGGNTNQRNVGKDLSKSKKSQPKYSYEIGKD